MGFQLTRTGWDRLSHVIVKVVDTALLAGEVKSPVILYLLLPKACADRLVSQLQSAGRVRTGWTPRLEYTVQISTPVADVVTPVFPYRLNTLLDDAIRYSPSATIQGKSVSSSVNSTFRAFEGAEATAISGFSYPGPLTPTTVTI